jgi:hypothetical protein
MKFKNTKFVLGVEAHVRLRQEDEFEANLGYIVSKTKHYELWAAGVACLAYSNPQIQSPALQEENSVQNKSI